MAAAGTTRLTQIGHTARPRRASAPSPLRTANSARSLQALLLKVLLLLARAFTAVTQDGGAPFNKVEFFSDCTGFLCVMITWPHVNERICCCRYQPCTCCQWFERCSYQPRWAGSRA